MHYSSDCSSKRNEATVEVSYDGNPNFVKIPGTVWLMLKLPNTVLLINNRFYVCENGVWFESGDAVGPWTYV